MESGWSPRIIRICRGGGGGGGVTFKQTNAGFAVNTPVAIEFDSITLRYNNIAVH